MTEKKTAKSFIALKNLTAILKSSNIDKPTLCVYVCGGSVDNLYAGPF